MLARLELFRWSVSLTVLAQLAVVISCGKHLKHEEQRHPIELSLVDSMYSEYMAVQTRAETEFTRTTGIAVRSIIGNEDTNSLASEQLEWLRSGASIPDICYLDNVWTGTLGQYLVDLSPYVSSAHLSEYIPEVLQVYKVGNRQVALPIETDFPLLYYRTDLLKKYGFSRPPRTWDELEHMAATIQAGERDSGNPNFWGYLWQAAASETLTCVGQEYQFSSGGGRIVERDGSVAVNNPQAARAFARATRWINTISPPGTPAYLEEDVRNVWEAGNGAFARNWGEGIATAQLKTSRIRGKFSVTVLPHDPGAPSASTVGGFGYGVSKFSRHPREAALLVQFLTDRTRQIWRLQANSQMPAIADLYTNPAFRSPTAFLQPVRTELFRSALARPAAIAGNRYPELSRAYAHGVHSILTRQATAPEALAALEKELNRIMGRKSAPAIPGS